jgi:hypothetical protein
MFAEVWIWGRTRGVYNSTVPSIQSPVDRLVKASGYVTLGQQCEDDFKEITIFSSCKQGKALCWELRKDLTAYTWYFCFWVSLLTIHIVPVQSLRVPMYSSFFYCSCASIGKSALFFSSTEQPRRPCVWKVDFHSFSNKDNGQCILFSQTGLCWETFPVTWVKILFLLNDYRYLCTPQEYPALILYSSSIRQ